MLDHYDIKLPPTIEEYHACIYVFRDDIPLRKAVLYKWFCELYSYELVGCFIGEYHENRKEVLYTGIVYREFSGVSCEKFSLRYKNYLDKVFGVEDNA